MQSFTFKVDGIKEILDVFEELQDQIGDKRAKSSILLPAMREAMKPVLMAAQENAPELTGGLRKSLQIEARRPNNKDKRSRYANSSDAVIALVTTASGKKLKKMGVKSDARVMAQEFGTATTPAHPYLRNALEANSKIVADNLGQILANKITKFKAKQK